MNVGFAIPKQLIGETLTNLVDASEVTFDDLETLKPRPNYLGFGSRHELTGTVK